MQRCCIVPGETKASLKGLRPFKHQWLRADFQGQRASRFSLLKFRSSHSLAVRKQDHPRSPYRSPCRSALPRDANGRC
jgi:hypothetical protein